VNCSRNVVFLLILLGCVCPLTGHGQIDPVQRSLVQLGYSAALEGHPPPSAYAFYYRNQPGFPSTNMTLRLAVDPTYLDSELGIRRAIGENTDFGIGVAGGGFADSYFEIDRGTYRPGQSFDGYGASGSLSVYHLFNPGQQIPLSGVLRGTGHYSTYAPTSDTDSHFQVPQNRGTFSLRTGLRWGGREPTLFPAVAMELSAWYDGQFRTGTDPYGFGDRTVEPQSHLFWAEALLAYTLPELKHSFYLGVTAGTTIQADRFSAYRLGSLLPLASEFPLSLPGYYYQELSARQFVLVGGNYMIPVDHRKRWNLCGTASSAYVDYLSGLEQPGHWNTGLGGGVYYNSPTWKILVGYGYGLDAIRSHGRGAQTIGILLQLDLGETKVALLNPQEPSRWRGLEDVLGIFGK
jgi:hypothetical protein